MVIKNVTRDQILEAAAQIFSEKGFHAASMRDIAEAVDLRKASLYHHVSSKQEILVDLLDTALDVLITSMEEVVSQDLSPDDKLRLAMKTYLGILTERRDLSSVLLFEHRSLEPEYHQRHIPRRDKFESLWRGIIEEGIDQKVFFCKNPRLAVKAVLGVINWTIMWYRPEGEQTPDEIADFNADLLIDGLRASG